MRLDAAANGAHSETIPHCELGNVFVSAHDVGEEFLVIPNWQRYSEHFAQLLHIVFRHRAERDGQMRAAPSVASHWSTRAVWGCGWYNRGC